MVALMCKLIILSKLLGRNDVRLIGLKFFAVEWVAFEGSVACFCEFIFCSVQLLWVCNDF